MKITVFALIGAICAIIVAGGVSCMVSESDPSPVILSLGATAGGILGSALSYGLDGDSLDSLTQFSSAYTEVVPEMKIGMPTF